MATSFLLFAVLACANLPERTSNRATSNNKTSANPSANTNKVSKNRWGYSEHEDSMGRGTVFHTSIQSSNIISLDFPYEGEQHGILSIREHPEHGKDIYMTIQKGQLLDSDYHGRVVVRFDNDKPLSFSSVSPADLSSETLFLRGNAFQVFINRLKTAKTLRVEVPVYQSGNQVFTFDVEGFTWKNQKR